MTDKRILLLTFIILVITVPVAFSVATTASHTTCIEGENHAYCGVTMDWMDIFDETQGPSGGSLAADTNANYREYYQGIGLALNKSIEDALIGESLPQAGSDSWWKGSAWDSPIGYPEYRYELHEWNSGGSGCNWVSNDDSADQASYLNISNGNSECGRYEANRYEASWRGGDGFDLGNDQKGSLNRFKVDTVTADIAVPGDSVIKFNLYKNDDDRNSGNRIGQAVFNGSKIRTLSNSGTTRQTVNLKYNPSKDTNNHIEEYNKTYYLDVEMERSSDGRSPRFGGETVLTRSYQPYRISSLPYSTFPQQDIKNLNSQMYQNFDSNYFASGRWDKDTSTSPRIHRSHFEQASAPNNDDHFQSSDTIVFHHGYIKIADVQPSILTTQLQSNGADGNGGNTGDYNLNSNWHRLMKQEGKVPVVYDIAVNTTPSDQSNYSSSPSDGDLKWSYSFDKNDIEFDLEFGYRKGESTPGQTGSVETEVIETVERESPGVYVFEYNKSDYDESEISRFYAEMNAEVTYDIDYEEYVVEYSDCPSDGNSRRTGYQLPDSAPADASSCSSSTDDYVDREYWDDLSSAPDGYDSSVTYELSNLGDEADDLSELLATPQQNEFDNDDFSYKTAYSPGKDRAYFERNVEENSLAGTRWTQIIGTGVSQRKTLFINRSGQFNTTVQVPRVPAVSDSGLPTVASSDKYVDDSSGTDVSSPDLNYAIDGEIDSSSNVTLDLYLAGPTSGETGEITVEVEGEEVKSFPLYGATFSRESIRDVETGINISDEVVGESEIDVNVTYDEEPIEDIRMDYVVRIDSGEPLNKIQSRWSYATFRNSRWDVTYEFQEPCNGADRCYNYSAHGTPIADNEINNGDSRGFAKQGPPDNITWHYPSGSMPVQAYLIPSTDTIITQRSGQSNTVYPAIPQDDSSLSSLAEAVTEAITNGESYREQSQVNVPLESDRCAPAPVENDDGNQEWRRFCDMYSGYVASEEVENAILEAQQEADSTASITSVKRNLEEELNESDSPEGNRKRKFDSPVNFSGQVQHSDYRPLRNESERTYYSWTQFEVVLDNNETSWSITGNASWYNEDMGEPDGRYLFDQTQMTIEYISNPLEQISDEERQELNQDDVQHELITEDSPDEAVQVKIKLQDNHGYPINLDDRESLYGSEDTDKIQVENARLVGTSGGTSWENNTYLTNEDGVVYVTVKPPEGEDEVLNAYFGGNEHDWWTHSTSKRLLTEASATAEINPETGDTSGDIQSILDIIIAWMFIIGGFLFVLSLIFRTNPYVDVSTVRFAKLMAEPFSGAISQFLVYLISMLILGFVFLLFAGIALGPEINPFDVIF